MVFIINVYIFFCVKIYMMKKILVQIFIVFTLLPLPAYAYIDPATGSMLFSVFIGVFSTLFFLFQNIGDKLKLIFTDKHLANTNTKFVIYSEGKKYDSLFLPILNEFEKREIPIVFYTSSVDDLAFKKNYKFVECQYIGSGNKAFLKLAFLSADICLMTTPHLDVFQLKRSKNVKHYCFIPHDIDDFCGYRLYGIDYYDSILMCTSVNGEYIREIEAKRNLPAKELVTVGSPQLDYMGELAKNISIDKKDKFTVLFAPSWGPSSVLARFGDIILEQLAKMQNWDVIFRPHPQSYLVEKEKLEYLFNKYKHSSNIVVDKSPDNIPSMAIADIMISDFSSINFEFAFLFNKPVLYSIQGVNNEIYDRATLGHLTWKDDAIKKIGIELTSENINNLVNIIVKAKNTTQIEDIKNIAWQKHGDGAKNTVDFLVAKQLELSENDRNSL